MFNKLKSLKNKKGFTLVELLVVIVILGILVLIAAPKFLGYTADAKVATMKADVKTIQQAAIVDATQAELKNGTVSYPVSDTKTLVIDFDGDAATTDDNVTAYVFDPAAVKTADGAINGVSLGNGAIDDYAIVTEGDHEGEVFKVSGVKGKDKVTQYGIAKATSATTATAN